MHDKQAKHQTWLIIKSEEEIRNLIELAIEDPETPPEVLQQLKDHQVITHFKNQQESLLSAKYWNLIPAQPLDDSKEFYYAILKDDDKFEMDRSNIKSYEDFLNED